MLSVADATRAEIEKLPTDLAGSAVAALAIAMAERIDAGRGSPSECGKVHLQALEQLRALAPPKREKDGIDQLAARRATRLARFTKTQDQSPS